MIRTFTWNGLEVTIRPLNDESMDSVAKAVTKKHWGYGAPKDHIRNRVQQAIVASVTIGNEVVHLIYPGGSDIRASIFVPDANFISCAYRMVYRDVCYCFYDCEFAAIVQALKLGISPSAYALISKELKRAREKRGETR